MEYMKNSVIEYDTTTIDDYIIDDYTSFDYTKVYSAIDEWDDDLFEYYQMEDNDKMERISHELYGSTDFWDILQLINNLDALYGMAYSYDVLDTAAENKLEKYKEEKPMVTITADHAEYMHTVWETENIDANEAKRIIKIVKPTKIQDFLRIGYETGVFK